jgi:hypothetical protein
LLAGASLLTIPVLLLIGYLHDKHSRVWTLRRISIYGVIAHTVPIYMITTNSYDNLALLFINSFSFIAVLYSIYFSVMLFLLE